MEVPTQLEHGNVEEYVDRRLFTGKIDSLDAHIERKQALADPTRYSILYLMYEYGRMSRAQLAEDTGRRDNGLQHHLRELLDANLIGRVPAPEGADGRQTYYRITTLGKQEIRNDIHDIVGGNQPRIRYGRLQDPEFASDGMTDARVVFEPDELNDHRESLRRRRAAHKQSVHATEGPADE